MNIGRIEANESKLMFSQFKFSRYGGTETSALVAQICIANLIKAFNGVLTEQQIRTAVGNAASPNQVSLAVRENLHPF